MSRLQQTVSNQGFYKFEEHGVRLGPELQKPSPEIIFTSSYSPHLLWKGSTRLLTDIISELYF
jgi:hypothetical protein